MIGEAQISLLVTHLLEAGEEACLQLCCCLFQSEGLSGMFDSSQPRTFHSLLLLSKVEKRVFSQSSLTLGFRRVIPLTFHTVAFLRGDSQPLEWCCQSANVYDLNFSFSPFNIGFSFHCVSHNTLLLNLSAALDL